MLHPLAIVSLVVLVVNDHVGKALAPGLVTGKLSDAAGIVLLPRMFAWLGVPPALAIAVSVAGFTLVKACAPVNSAWNTAFSWLYAAAGLPWVAGVRMDPWDLAVVPLALVWLTPWGRR